MTDPTKNNALANRIAAVVVLLMATGVVFVFSDGANLNRQIEWQRFWQYTSLRQLVLLPFAVLLKFAVSRFNYRRLGMAKGMAKSPATYLLGLSIILLIVVLIPRFGAEINYARRWLRIPLGPAKLSFQPSELAKWALIIFLAGCCDRYADRFDNFWKGFFLICLPIGLVAGLILLEDFGTAALVVLLGVIIIAAAGAKMWHLLTPLPFAGAAFIGAILCSPARCKRILAFLHPDQWADSVNYQPNQSLIAIGSGSIFGKGLGMGICKYGHLPEDTTDFIFAIIGEEMGFIGTFAVIILFAVFVWLGLLVVIRCQDAFGRLLAAGIVLAVGIQAALNIGVVAVVLPTKGIPLPFVSAGGTSLLLSAAAVGILMSIARQTPIPNRTE